MVIGVGAAGAGAALAAAPAGGAGPTTGAGRHAGPAVSAPATVPTGPALNIRVDDGRTTVRRGDRLRYAITVRNLGGTTLRSLHVDEMLPTGLATVSSQPKSAGTARQPGWTFDLPAGRDAMFTTAATLAVPPAGQLRLAAVACVTAGHARRPAVCSADSDAMPDAGAPPAAGGPGGTRARHSGWLRGGPGALAATVAAATAGAVTVRRIRRRPATAPAAHDGAAHDGAAHDDGAGHAVAEPGSSAVPSQRPTRDPSLRG
jgi:uncharacterized repeat protein (TIGR01451 family)